MTFLGKHINTIHSNVQIMNAEIRQDIQLKGLGFPEFLLIFRTELLRYRLNFHLCQYIYSLFLTVFCHKDTVTF